MNYEIEVTSFFAKQLKRLSKKFPSLKNEFSLLIKDLENNIKTGVQIGNNCYKIRISIASKKKGKSGGARVITHLQITNSKLYLLSIYDKSEKDNITEKELDELLKNI
jgi:mRNA-degrading endonuclease RelE of RelBE toxin-antitoxin system